MLLLELLTAKVPYEVSKETADSFQTHTKIGDRYIWFAAVRYGDAWEVLFYETKELDSKSTFGLTGSGNEFKVLSMVIASFKEFLERYHPDRIEFSSDKSDGESRTSLYKKLADKFLNNWDKQVLSVGTTTIFHYSKLT